MTWEERMFGSFVSLFYPRNSPDKSAWSAIF